MSIVSRTPLSLQASLASAGIAARQRAIANLNLQLSSGQKIQNISDDLFTGLQTTRLDQQIERNEQLKKNLQVGQNALSLAEQTLRGVSSAIDSARSIAISNATNTVSDVERQAAALQVDAIVDDLVRQANQKFHDRHQFAGQQILTPPFRREGQYVVFTGDQKDLSILQEIDSPLAASVIPQSAIGGRSSAGLGSDLNPRLLSTTRLSALHGGQGVDKGVFTINTGAGDVAINLASADSIGDVVAQINSTAGHSATASIDPSGAGLRLTSASNITVKDLPGGVIADQLGIRANNVASPIVGSDLDPAIDPTTALTALNNGAGVSLAGGLRITNGTFSKDIDLTGANTVEDVVNTINAAGIFVKAEINADRTGINVVSVLSGAGFAITETSLAGTTASTLGLRTTTLETRLSDFNLGNGVETASGPDLRIRIHDATAPNGGVFDIDLDGATTLADLKSIIESQTGNRVTVSVNGLGGIQLVDTTAGAQSFEVQTYDGKPTATNLGLVQNAGAGGTIDGTPKHQARIEGVFDSLLRLKDGLERGDESTIEQASKFLDADRDRVLTASGALGGRLQVYGFALDRLQDRNAQTQTERKEIFEPDLAEVITRLTAEQTAFQASLASTSRLLQGSLLDYL